MQGYFIFDIECDSLDPTKIHCLSVIHSSGSIKSTSSYEDMRKFFSMENVNFVGHNIVEYDIPAAEKILKIKLPKSVNVIDTLALSWYLEDNRGKHSLKSYGEDFGYHKVEIDDWENLSSESYIERCERDCKINHMLFERQLKLLNELYQDSGEVMRVMKYLSFKKLCGYLARKSKWKLDVDLCTKYLNELNEEKLGKVKELESIMPKARKYTKLNKPETLYKNNGELSARGARWLEELRKQGLPEDFEGPIDIVSREEDPSPTSGVQVKAWLFSLGWEPKLFKETKLKNGGTNAVPQINKADKSLCESVLKLCEIEPGIKVLDKLGTLTARIGVLEGFLRNQKDGYLVAAIVGFANTMRMRHGELVNLPKMNQPYGKYVKPCLTSPDGYELVECDLSSLENMTRNNFIYNIDRKYVETMLDPDYDSHIDLAVIAEMMTTDEAEFYKLFKKEKDLKGDIEKETDPEEGRSLSEKLESLQARLSSLACNQGLDEAGKKELYSKLNKTRDKAKTTNYSALYGIGAKKLSKELQISLSEATKLLDGYKKKNWAVEKFTSSIQKRVVNGTTYVFNPLSKFWYTLRNEKDVFSVINQSAGDYFFNRWLFHIIEQRPQLTGQFHDSVILTVKEGNRDNVKKLLLSALEKANKETNLDIPIACDIKYGKNYGFEN